MCCYPGGVERTAFALVLFAGAASALAPQGPAEGSALDLRGVTRAEFAGNDLPAYPFFEVVRAFNEGDTVKMAVDPSLHPQVVGQTADVYVVAAKSQAEWLANPGLTDVGGGPQSVTFSGGGIQANTFTLDAGTLSGQGGTDLALGYDVVVDLDGDGRLSGGDLADGFGDRAGFHVALDLTAPGPFAVTEILYSGGAFLGQDAYFPSSVAALGQLPLVVISHGNGHNFQWYDHIGVHLASYGYVVVSHQNNTGPGVETASTTTLTNTDYFLGNLPLIGGGILDGHVDGERIVLIGHGRGGEGVVRAYDKLVDGTFVPGEFDADSIRAVVALGPSVFLGPALSDPHTVPFEVWVGAADPNTGCPSTSLAQPLRLHDRARGARQSVYLHGVEHSAFHAVSTGSGGVGPCLVAVTDTHAILRGHLLALVEHHADDNFAARDFLTRQWESFRPIGAPASPCVVVDLTYRGDPAEGFVIDDFEANPGAGVSSSGGAVTFTVTDLFEGGLQDGDGVFTHDPADPMNGMTFAAAGDARRGVAFTYDGLDRLLAFEVVPEARDFTRFGELSFRACQSTRHPLTVGDVGDTTFAVTLRDAAGTASTIRIGLSGGGLEEPYQRTGCGLGTGWANEMETTVLRLADFLTDASGLDLRHVVAVEFAFGPSFGTPSGRLGLDDVLLSP